MIPEHRRPVKLVSSDGSSARPTVIEIMSTREPVFWGRHPGLVVAPLRDRLFLKAPSGTVRTAMRAHRHTTSNFSVCLFQQHQSEASLLLELVAFGEKNKVCCGDAAVLQCVSANKPRGTVASVCLLCALAPCERDEEQCASRGDRKSVV